MVDSVIRFRFRSIRLKVFYKICFPKTFTIFRGKHLDRSIFLNKVNFIKYSSTGVFLSILRTNILMNICERLFPQVVTSVKFQSAKVARHQITLMDNCQIF